MDIPATPVIAVAGGTGCVGRHVVESVARLGATPVVIARSAGVDLLTGSGLDDALRGVYAVIDVTNIETLSRARATDFFSTATRHLLAAEERAGVRHHVVLSIVGVDVVRLGYYRAKLRQEELVREGRVPWTVLRATQFHEFSQRWLGAGPVAVVPQMRSQPVAAREVGDELARLALAPAAGMAPELAGPGEERVPDMVRRLARSRGRRTAVVPVSVPGASGRAVRGGALVPSAPGPRGSQTYDEWLVERS